MHYSTYGKTRGFVIHLSTSDLVSQLVTDSEALKNEKHEPGFYDETGDYIPQYSGDPEDLKYVGANPSNPASSGTDTGSVGGPSEPSEPVAPKVPSDTEPGS